MRDRSAAAIFGIVVYQGVEPIDIGGTVGVISMARRVLPAIEAAVVAAEPGQVALAGGLSIIAQHGFADALTFESGDSLWRPRLASGSRGCFAACVPSPTTGDLYRLGLYLAH